MVKNASSSGTRLRAYYKLQRPPDSLAGLRGREGKGKRGEGTRGEKGRGEGGKRDGRSARGRVASQFQLLDPLAAVVIVGAGRPPDIDQR